jgi:hypothetical protein
VTRLPLTLIAIFSVHAPSFAHGISAKIQRTAMAVTVTVTFDGGDPAEDCVVTVATADGSVVAKGPTNTNGAFTFPLPGPGNYAVVADAGAGHVARATLTIPVATRPEPDATADPAEIEGTLWRFLGLTLGLGGIFVGTVAFRARARLK